ncbi:HEPN domain-containing protein [Dyadobacter sp. 676]|uniref:HEPN domain-containing protein n=1 Tax=Dyadobacter sp. 676 TaxID=3088362 RepID=A0AAU8FKD6_9BACT
MEPVISASNESPLSNAQKLADAHQIIVDVFHESDLDHMRTELWYLLKAVTTDQPFSFQGDPSAVLYLGRQLSSIIKASKLMLEVAREQNEVFPTGSFPAFSPERIAADRQYLRDIGALNEQYGGAIRRLTFAEAERPILAIKRVFDSYDYDDWQRILEDWIEYGLGRVSICEATGECVEVVQYELLETLLEAIYLVHSQGERNLSSVHTAAWSAASRAITELLKSALQPELLFEIRHSAVLSAAEQTPYRDLLIVLPDNNHKPFKELEPIIEVITAGEDKICCTIRKMADLRHCLESGHIYFSLVCTAENLVYQKKGTAIPKIAPEKLTELIAKSRQDFFAGMSKARNFFHGACCYEETREYALSMFMLQQTVEITYRSMVISLLGNEKRTHSIRLLKNFNHRVAPQLNEIFPGGSPEEERLIQLLEDAYLEARYNFHYELDKEDLDVVFSRVSHLLELAESAFEERINAIVKTSA